MSGTQAAGRTSIAPVETARKITSSKNSLWRAWQTYLPVMALLTAVLLWGGSFAAMRVTIQAISPAGVMWIRMAIAFVVLLPFALKLWPGDYRRGDWKKLLPLVMLQPCLYFLLESHALQLTTSSQAGVVSASVPLLVTVGAWLYLKEAITIRTVAGLVLAMTGVIGLTWMQRPGTMAENPLLGNLLEVAAMACAAANMLLVKEMSRRYNPWTLTAMQVLAGIVFFLPGARDLWHFPAGDWKIALVSALLFLGAIVTLGAFGLYNWGMSRMPASSASLFIYLVPVCAVLIGWTTLGEGLSGYQCVAAALVILGVWWSQRR
jgi:drug/metabolite transporter (DMT)-like permease